MCAYGGCPEPSRWSVRTRPVTVPRTLRVDLYGVCSLHLEWACERIAAEGKDRAEVWRT